MNKIKQVQKYLTDENIDFAFITTPDNVFYFSNFKSDPHERLLGLIIFPNSEPILVCPKMEVPDAKNSGWNQDMIGHLDTDNPWELIFQEIESRQISVANIAIEKSHFTVERFESLQQLYPHANFYRLDDKINQLRVIKDQLELDKMRKAAQLADYAIEVGCKTIREGITEVEIRTAIENAITEKGYAMSFETIVLSGPNTSSPHGVPGSRKVQHGDLILFDLGVVYEGYCSDITRTVAFGDISDEKKEIYDTVRKANESAISSVKPGVRAMDIDTVARDIISNAGYGDYFPHRLGHGLGVSIHEYPSIMNTNDLVLAPGMVFTIEPGIYHEIAGVRIEDDIVVTENGVEVLTKYTKDLVIL